MERNLRADGAALSASLAGADELMLWNADVSSLTVQNDGDVFRRLANVAPLFDCEDDVVVFELRFDDRTAWTNEKHNLYLNHLEVSFVTQLHKSRDSVYENMTQKKPVNFPEQFTASQYGLWQRIDHRREPLSCPPADSHNCMKNSWICFHRPSPSANLQGFQKLSDNEKNSSRKGNMSHGLATCSQQVSTMNLCQADTFDSMKEGTGQNYVSEDNEQTNPRSGVEKMKST
ncbi:hypothetical protein F511_24850 [Dorcoceras hygrometricum]|uniref:Uncharacterized protein n=1 Tax=Dorcoceras hygrometricum TaxID=472368 RepID=A0A2Z7BS74_9LAMI|nr:hypothetical protein F511_24850 [Dorcoceras hygrometricum]